jgi:hypothetical protein
MYNEIIVEWLVVRDFSGNPALPARMHLEEFPNYQV